MASFTLPFLVLPLKLKVAGLAQGSMTPFCSRSGRQSPGSGLHALGGNAGHTMGTVWCVHLQYRGTYGIQPSCTLLPWAPQTSEPGLQLLPGTALFWQADLT